MRRRTNDRPRVEKRSASLPWGPVRCTDSRRDARDRERDESKCRRGHRATGTLMHWCRERKGVWPLWNAVWDFLGNAADPVIPSFSSLAFTQEKRSHVHRKTRTRMYQKLKTTPCLSAGECTSKL